MKRFFSILMVISLSLTAMFILTACSKEEDEVETTNQTFFYQIFRCQKILQLQYK